MQKFRFLEHTADAFFQAFGKSFAELLVNSAAAMCSVMYELKEVATRESVDIEVGGENRPELLHNFLGAVLLEIEEREMLFREFRVRELDEKRGKLRCELLGEKLDRTRHRLKTEVKAVTWHDFFVRKEGNKWVSQVLVDI